MKGFVTLRPSRLKGALVNIDAEIIALKDEEKALAGNYYAIYCKEFKPARFFGRYEPMKFEEWLVGQDYMDNLFWVCQEMHIQGQRRSLAEVADIIRSLLASTPTEVTVDDDLAGVIAQYYN